MELVVTHEDGQTVRHPVDSRTVITVLIPAADGARTPATFALAGVTALELDGAIEAPLYDAAASDRDLLDLF